MAGKVIRTTYPECRKELVIGGLEEKYSLLHIAVLFVEIFWLNDNIIYLVKLLSELLGQSFDSILSPL